MSSESYGSLLSSVLMNKVPQDLPLIVCREIKGGDGELDLLLKVLHQELEARKKAAKSQNTYSPTTNTPHRTNDQPWDDPPTASALTSTSRTSPTCTYCKQPRASNKCKTVAEKKLFMMRPVGGTSLNACLFTGPSLSQKIVDIILRFRKHRKAFVGDIEKVFLRLKLAEGGFNLRKFVINSADLRNRIEENETRLQGVYPAPPTREEDASDKANLKPTAVSDPTSKLVLEDEQSYTEMSLGDTQPDDKL